MSNTLRCSLEPYCTVPSYASAMQFIVRNGAPGAI